MPDFFRPGMKVLWPILDDVVQLADESPLPALLLERREIRESASSSNTLISTPLQWSRYWQQRGRDSEIHAGLIGCAASGPDTARGRFCTGFAAWPSSVAFGPSVRGVTHLTSRCGPSSHTQRPAAP